MRVRSVFSGYDTHRSSHLERVDGTWADVKIVWSAVRPLRYKRAKVPKASAYTPPQQRERERGHRRHTARTIIVSRTVAYRNHNRRYISNQLYSALKATTYISATLFRPRIVLIPCHRAYSPCTKITPCPMQKCIRFITHHDYPPPLRHCAFARRSLPSSRQQKIC